MRIKRESFPIKLLAVVLAAATVVAAATAFAARAAKVELEAKMSGKQEVPGPGDTKGKGTAQLQVNTKKQKVCFLFEYDIPSGTATAGHIHKGAKGEDGKIVVELFTSEQQSPVEDCVKVDKKRLLKRIVKSPADFYVNLHNDQFPDGAIRGQLKLAPGGP
jgi:hypothetical protein